MPSASMHTLHRYVTNEDLESVDKFIASFEACQQHLYLYRNLLGQVGKVDAVRADLKRGIEVEQNRMQLFHDRAEALQATVNELQREVDGKRGELAALHSDVALARDELQRIKTMLGV